MQLYLARHGDALSKNENPDRPLSENGRLTVQKVASFLARSRFNVSQVVHSHKLRAQETALILSKGLGAGSIVQESSVPIGPNDEIWPLYNMLQYNHGEGSINDQMYVGHLPYLDRLLSSLVCGNEELSVVSFEPGMVVALEREMGSCNWVVQWALMPRLLGQ